MNPELQSALAAVARRPKDAGAHFVLAQAYDQAGKTDAAIASAGVAVQIAPWFAQAHHLLGCLLARRGDFGNAIASLQRAISARPGYPRAYNNLGHSLRAAGRLAEAESAFASAVRLRPDYQLAQHNLGAIRQALGRSDEAVAAFNESLRLNPEFRPSWSALGGAERLRGHLDQSIAAYRKAIELDGEQSAAERIALAEVLAESGFDDESRRVCGEALGRTPDSLPANLGFHLGLPLVYADARAVGRARSRFTAGLGELEREFERLHRNLDAAAALESWRRTNLFLAYQGRDDRNLQQRYARLLARAVDYFAPGLRQPDPAPRESRPRIRVGFVSACFIESAVGQTFLRWITELDRGSFEVFVYHLAPGCDALTQRTIARADRFHHAQGAAATIGSLVSTISSDALDVLVYPELGIDGRCMVLAAMRLAPVQCAGWGHPVTTGHDTIDCFFSVDAMEPAGADAHYVEKLVRLPGIGVSYPRQAAAIGHRGAFMQSLCERFDIPAGAPLFLCPQALFRILPADDVLFARVLEAVPDSILLLVEGPHRELTARVVARLEMALATRGVAAGGRILLLAPMTRAELIEVGSACNALLDTTAWSGNVTTIDALAAASPVVTLPGRLMRARQSAAMLTICGVPGLVARDADDYVRIAARLATDAGWCANIRARISMGCTRLFDDRAALDAFAQFIRDAHSRARGSAPPPTGERLSLADPAATAASTPSGTRASPARRSAA